MFNDSNAHLIANISKQGINIKLILKKQVLFIFMLFPLQLIVFASVFDFPMS